MCLLLLFGTVAITLLLSRFGVVFLGLTPHSICTIPTTSSLTAGSLCRALVVFIPIVACGVIIASGVVMRTFGHHLETSIVRYPPAVQVTEASEGALVAGRPGGVPWRGQIHRLRVITICIYSFP